MGKSKMKKMKSLPEDLIISILVKLQVKPLMRFRCVCKLWYHLIKSPNFIEMHQRSNQNKSNECIIIKRMRNVDSRSILSYYSNESFDEIPPHMEVPHFNDSSQYEISWPCNGLLLCVSDAKLTSLSDSISNSNVDCRNVSVLFNPATRESKLLPPNPYDVSKQRHWRSAIGLGFDSNQNDYKAVTIEYKDKAHIYSLSSNSWKQIEHVMPNHYHNDGNGALYGSGVLFNGALHWSAYRNKIDIIFSFDVSTEMFQDINLPDVLAQDDTDKTVTLLNGCLAMFSFNHEDTLLTTFVDIWVMKVGSWTKQMSISGLMDDIIVPSLFWKNEAILFDTRVRGCSKLKLWALDTLEMTETGISSDDYYQSFIVYKESLVSVLPFD